jgi:hypothetical protein
LVFGVALAGVASAQPPGGSTAQCRDGTYSAAHEKDAPCANHGGVARWYGKRSPSENEATRPVGVNAPSPQKQPQRPASEERSSIDRSADGSRLAERPIALETSGLTGT